MLSIFVNFLVFRYALDDFIKELKSIESQNEDISSREIEENYNRLCTKVKGIELNPDSYATQLLCKMMILDKDKADNFCNRLTKNIWNDVEGHFAKINNTNNYKKPIVLPNEKSNINENFLLNKEENVGINQANKINNDVSKFTNKLNNNSFIKEKTVIEKKSKFLNWVKNNKAFVGIAALFCVAMLTVFASLK